MQLHYWLVILLIAAAPLQNPPATASTAQTTDQQAAQAPKVKAEDLPVDIGRIQRALANTPMLRFDKDNRPVFRVQVFGEKPTIDDILGPDWAKGPVPYGGMTHQEFLDMVTPKDVQGYAAFSNKEGASWRRAPSSSSGRCRRRSPSSRTRGMNGSARRHERKCSTR